jgi:hypothetical protein
VESRSQIELPDSVAGAFEVFVNGVPQHAGVDFDQIGGTLVFRSELAGEGRLGFWRWLSLFFGVAGTYRRNDSVDVVYDRGGRRTVVTLQPTQAQTDGLA